MNHRLIYRAALPLFLLLSLTTRAGAGNCEFVAKPAGSGQIGTWIDRDNWLSEAHRRVTLQAAEVFVPTRQYQPASIGSAAPRLLPENLPVRDPLDASLRDLGFVLDSHLRADAVLVLRQGKVIGERYRNGYRPEQPRLLLGATRPLLNVLGSIAIAQGKAKADQSLSRAVPALLERSSLRKFSLQRLLENSEGFNWSAEELSDWRAQSARSDGHPEGVRAWLAADARWPRKLEDLPPLENQQTPDADLLAWSLSSLYQRPLADVFCEQLFRRNPPRYPVHWLTDTAGNELGNGLALSLHDFAQLGQVLLDTRAAAGRSRVPSWLVEALATKNRGRTAALAGLPKGSEQRYGFVHLGGSGSRVALIGDGGASLMIDFDRRLVVAMYARPASGEERTLRDGLMAVWDALGQMSRSMP